MHRHASCAALCSHPALQLQTELLGGGAPGARRGGQHLYVYGVGKPAEEAPSSCLSDPARHRRASPWAGQGTATTVWPGSRSAAAMPRLCRWLRRTAQVGARSGAGAPGRHPAQARRTGGSASRRHGGAGTTNLPLRHTGASSTAWAPQSPPPPAHSPAYPPNPHLMQSSLSSWRRWASSSCRSWRGTGGTARRQRWRRASSGWVRPCGQTLPFAEVLCCAQRRDCTRWPQTLEADRE